MILNEIEDRGKKTQNKNKKIKKTYVSTNIYQNRIFIFN